MYVSCGTESSQRPEELTLPPLQARLIATHSTYNKLERFPVLASPPEMASPLTDSNFTQWRIDTNCSIIHRFEDPFDLCSDDIVTSSMVDFLNLTRDGLSSFKDAYCLSPPDDDNCPYGYCPNPDVAGKPR